MAEFVCDHCGKSGAEFLCSRCKTVRFCGQECFKTAWKAHKPFCKPPAEGASPATSAASPSTAAAPSKTNQASCAPKAADAPKATSAAAEKVAAPVARPAGPMSEVRKVPAPKPLPTQAAAPAKKKGGVDYSKFANIEDSDDEAIVVAPQPVHLPHGANRDHVTREIYDMVWVRLLQNKNLPFAPPPDLDQMWGYYKYGALDEQALLDQACEVIGEIPSRLNEANWKMNAQGLARKLDNESREDEARMWCVIHMLRFPSDGDAYYNHGVLLNKMCDKAKFSGSLNMRLPALSAPSTVVPMEKYVGLFQRAAVTNYRRALKVDPKSRPSYINLIGCLERNEPKNWYEDVHQLAAESVRHGLWYNIWQRPPHFVSSLVSQALHDPQKFLMCRMLEENYPTIRAEYDAYVERLNNRKDWDDSDTIPGLGEVGARPGALHDGGLTKSGHWKEAPLYANGCIQQEYAEYFPETLAILQRHARDATGIALCGGGDIIFSVLTPGTHLRAHCGPSNSRLTAHMGIKVPRTLEQGLRMRVAAEKPVCWEEGKCIVFDDSFEHEVFYPEADAHEPYPGDRVVLMVNYWHPDFEFKNDPQWRQRSDEMMANMEPETLPKTALMPV